MQRPPGRLTSRPFRAQLDFNHKGPPVQDCNFGVARLQPARGHTTRERKQWQEKIPIQT